MEVPFRQRAAASWALPKCEIGAIIIGYATVGGFSFIGLLLVALQ